MFHSLKVYCVGAPRNRLWRLVIIVMIYPAAFTASAGFPTAQLADGEARRFDFRIENGRVADRAKTVPVRQGEAVELAWLANRRAVLHLHGHDVDATVVLGVPQKMALLTDATGRGSVELRHGHHAVPLYISKWLRGSRP